MAKERGNSSTTTSGPTAEPKRLQVQTTWTYLTYLQYQGNLAITKLLGSLKKLYLFCNLHTTGWWWMSCPMFLGGGEHILVK
jgi:hypothetical protein